MTDSPQNRQDADLRQATILFADISGFTALSHRMDPEDLRDAIKGCFAIIERCIVEHGGTVDKFIGDCVMALFGAPQALEQAPRRAVNAAIVIRNRLPEFLAQRGLSEHLDVHIGLNTGRVVAGNMGTDVNASFSVMGSDVNRASRLLGVASAGQVIVGESTYRATAQDFEYRATKPLKLKGEPAPVVAYELISRDVADQAKRKDSPMVGREAELRILEERLRFVSGGAGSIVSIVAENGMGKSRLLVEVQRRAEDLPILEGRSVALGRALSFHPFVDLLRHWAAITSTSHHAEAAQRLRDAVASACGEEAQEILPFIKTLMALPLEATERETVEGLPGDALEKLIRRNVRRLIELASRQRPIVLVFEDLHWADESSLTLLEATLPLCATHPVLFILACRPGYEATSDRTLGYVERELATHYTRLRLAPLQSRECDQLIKNLLGAAELPHPTRVLVKAKAEGNPFYIEEVLRSLLDQGVLKHENGQLVVSTENVPIEIPGTIEEVIMSRVDRLAHSTRSVLQVASVLGRRSDARVLERIAPPDVDLATELDILQKKQFLEKTTSWRTGNPRLARIPPVDEYVFKHALLQEVVYASLLKKTRRDLHARCAEALESVFAERLSDALGMLAYHWNQAERLEKAEPYLLRAGEEAARSAASAEALHYFTEAYRVYLLVHGDKADDAKRALLEKNIGFALLNAGRLSESIEHMNAALRLYGIRVPTGDVAPRLQLALDLPVVLFHLYSSSSRKPKKERPHDLDIYATMYNRCRAQNPTDPHRNFFDNIATMRHLHHVDTSRVEHAAGMYAAAGAFFAFAGISFKVARRFLAEAENVSRHDRPTDRFQCLTMSTIVDFHEGEWSGANDVDEELLAIGVRSGLLWDADIYLGLVCERELRQGDFAAAERRLGTLDLLIRDYGYDFSRSTRSAMTAFLLLEQRRLDEAAEAMRAYLESRHEEPLRIFGASGLARVHVLRGELDTASAHLDEAEHMIRRSRRLPAFYCGAYWNSRLHLAIARLAGGEARAREAIKVAKRAVGIADGIARDRTEAYRLTARAYALDGKTKIAETWWTKALDEGERLGVRPELARTCADIARALLETGSIDARFRDRTASDWSALAESEIAALGIRSDVDLPKTTAPRLAVDGR